MTTREEIKRLLVIRALRGAAIAAVVLFLLGQVVPFGAQVSCLRTNAFREDGWPHALQAAHIFGDGMIATAYMLIPWQLFLCYMRMKARPTTEMFGFFGAFIFLCGCTHITNILRFWFPFEYAFAVLKNATGGVSLGVYAVLRHKAPEIEALGETSSRLQEEIAAKDAALREKEQALEQAEQVRLEIVSTAQKLVDANARITDHVRLLEARDRAIQELASPLYRIRRGVVLVPLVGVFDSARALDLQTRLGNYITNQVGMEVVRAVVLDLTGIEAIDSAVAKALHDLARFLGLLGTRAVATGMRATVAQALVALDLSLPIPTLPDLESGVRAALASPKSNE